MRGLVTLTIGITIGFILACYVLDEEPSYAFDKMVGNI